MPSSRVFAGIGFAQMGRRAWAGVSILVLGLLCSGLAWGASPAGADRALVLENAALRVSIDPTTAAWEVLDKRCDRLWRQASDETLRSRLSVGSLHAVSGSKLRAEAAVTYSYDGKKRLPLTVRWELDAEKAEMGFEVSGDPQAEMPEIPLPGPLVLDAPRGMMVVSHQAGLLFGVDEVRWHGRKFTFTMPWFGAEDMANGQGYMAIAEGPDDVDLRGCKVPGTGRDVLSMQFVQLAQKGRFGYARRVRYAFFDRGGYVAMAKRYRAYARQQGLVKTLLEKRRERPSIDRLVGAVNIYGRQFDNIKELKRLGVERALVSGFSKDQVRQMNEWGYLPGRYDIYTDLYEPGTRPSTWERCEGFHFPEDVIKKPDGSNLVGWCPVVDPKTGKKDPSYVICWTCGLRTLKEKMPKRLAESPFSSYFLDCVTATALRECYDPHHPLTRTQDRETRVAQFAYLSKDLGLVVGSEEGRGWAVAAADYFEGVMGTGTWLAFNKQLHALPFEPFTPKPEYVDLTLNPARRAPLFQLVFGDCAETTWRWGDSNTRMPEFWTQKDLLNILYASMPTWILWSQHQDFFRAKTDRFLECYNRVCRWRRAVGYSEMTDHERLSDDGMVQKSRFANGASVTVNFAREARTLAGGTTMPARSYLIEGPKDQLPGLPVGQPVQVGD